MATEPPTTPVFINMSPPVECWKCKRVRPSVTSINITAGAAGSVSSTMKPLCEECASTYWLNSIKAARRDAFKEAADMLLVKPDAIRLACGELTAQEMRSVRAVLRWQSQQMMNQANEA